MTSFLFDFVCLSLLPSWRWPAVAEGLRAGDTPRELFARLADLLWHSDPGEVVSLRARAAAAVERAHASGLTPVTWSDATYPAGLAAIIDPPPVLWTRGALEALVQPSVAIVGSRAASSYALS